MGAGGDPLSAALADLPQVRSEAELSQRLQEIAAMHFGASGAILLTREPALVSGRRIARLTGGGGSSGVAIAMPGAEARMTAGAPFFTAAPDADLPGVGAPHGAARAALIPCCGEGSMTALCLFWPAAGEPVAASRPDRLRLLAATAGMAFDRQVSALRDRLARADLDNRVRNVLAVVRAVGTRSAERAGSIEQFLLHFEGRIDAISRSQVPAAGAGEISFEHLLREELLAQTIQDDENVSLDGIDVPVTAEQSEALGLALHELAVNAVKFGAFAGPNGALTVRWWVETGAEGLALNIDWRERCGGGATVRPPQRAGFGLVWLERALPFQLDAAVSLDFAPTGLRCRIAAPIQGGGTLQARPAAVSPSHSPPGRNR